MAGENYTYDGATGRLRLGAFAIQATKMEPPKESIKTEKVRRVGEQVATVRTVGVYEIDGASIEVESAVFARSILPRVTSVGWNLFEFPITILQRHPLVGGPYSQIWDRCRFAGIEQDAIEASEKALKVKLPIDVIQVFHRGADGIWKSLATIPSQPSPQAAAFMF